MSDSRINLRELLERPIGDFPMRPQLPGKRTFFGKITGLEASCETNQKQTPFLRFSARLTEPGKDVTAQDLEAILSSGFNLADYNVGRKFHISPTALPFLRQFLLSVGCPIGVGFIDFLALSREYDPLDPVTYKDAVTPETIDRIRGLDIMIQTPAPDDKGRVFANNVDVFTGVTR